MKNILRPSFAENFRRMHVELDLDNLQRHYTTWRFPHGAKLIHLLVLFICILMTDASSTVFFRSRVLQIHKQCKENDYCLIVIE